MSAYISLQNNYCGEADYGGTDVMGALNDVRHSPATENQIPELEGVVPDTALLRKELPDDNYTK